ncbi:Hypothetical protein PBC10988_11590 [Planctomycetales bacterium 10988]|nr:Hypothetical protein PBC10988_11590 [Planctomycetales bacterium 10988]
MNTPLLNKKFADIGARMKVAKPSRWWLRSNGPISLDIASDRRGEFFEITSDPDADLEVEVLDVQPTDRHLLLLVREEGEKSKYLCGHDERHWFVAGIPESAPVGTVPQAKQALQPARVQTAVSRKKLGKKDRYRRKNEAYLRQGEWFFLPVENLQVDERCVLRNEPLQRGFRSKPHKVDFCYRIGGETVYVCGMQPNGVTEGEYRKILEKNPKANKWGWRVMRRNPGVFVRGRVRHADHATIKLKGWHRVVMNTEDQSQAMRNVAFLD